MKATYKNWYPKNETIVLVYTVEGTQTELARYESVKGDYYRVDVLQHPDATDHQNIRQFIQYGWAGITFEGCALE